ncbi:MAG: helix-turn-helix transcriptional regulator [Clostridia bacterium]|nr:helix-turn-helix transcriptional regulator [Clostridia bacterium]
MERRIVERKDYGEVQIILSKVLKSKGITVNKLATLVDSRYDTVKSYVDNNIQRTGLDLLARICYALDCKLQDIIEYKK